MVTQSINFKAYSYFVACVEHKSIHAAAEACHISQPALSRAIQKLESDLGVQILERRPRGVTPTPYGDVLFRYAKLVERQLKQATIEIDAMRGKIKGMVSVGVIPTASNFISHLSQIVTSTHPELILRLTADSTSGLLPSLTQGDIDYAVVLSLSESIPGLEFIPLLKTHTNLVVRNGHPLLDEIKLTLETLYKYPWVMGKFPAQHRERVSRTFLDAGIPPPQPSIEVNSIAYFSDIIRNTDHIGIASTALTKNPGWGRNITSLDFDFGFPEEIIGLAFRSNTVSFPGADIIKSIIIQEASKVLTN